MYPTSLTPNPSLIGTYIAAVYIMNRELRLKAEDCEDVKLSQDAAFYRDVADELVKVVKCSKEDVLAGILEAPDA